MLRDQWRQHTGATCAAAPAAQGRTRGLRGEAASFPSLSVHPSPRDFTVRTGEERCLRHWEPWQRVIHAPPGEERFWILTQACQVGGNHGTLWGLKRPVGRGDAVRQERESREALVPQGHFLALISQHMSPLSLSLDS